VDLKRDFCCLTDLCRAENTKEMNKQQGLIDLYLHYWYILYIWSSTESSPSKFPAKGREMHGNFSPKVQ